LKQSLYTRQWCSESS